jgi:hypothetical protein
MSADDDYYLFSSKALVLIIQKVSCMHFENCYWNDCLYSRLIILLNSTIILLIDFPIENLSAVYFEII